METTYRLSEKELDDAFLNSIKSLYKNKNISITIEEKLDETEYLLNSNENKKKILDSIQSSEGYSLSMKEFKSLSSNLLKGQKINRSKLKRVKIS